MKRTLITLLSALVLAVGAAQSPAEAPVAPETAVAAQGALEATSEAAGRIAAPSAIPTQVVIDAEGDPVVVNYDPSTRLADFWATQAALVPLVLLFVALLKRHVPLLTSHELLPLGASFLSGIGLALLGKMLGFLVLDWEGAVTFGVGSAVLASGGRTALFDFIAKVFDLKELAKVLNGTETVVPAEPVQTVKRTPSFPDPDEGPTGGQHDSAGAHRSPGAIRQPAR